jgi:hypothetical protein
MMRIFILMLMVMWFTAAWGSDKVNEPDRDENNSLNIDDNLDINTRSDAALTIEQCQASEHYVTIDGRYVDVENKCLRSPEPVGCLKADILCEEAIAIAQAPNGKSYWFPNLCIPNGWQVVKHDDDMINLNECSSLKATTFQSTSLTWSIGQLNSAGFRIWRVVEDGTGRYKQIITLKEINSYQGNCIEGKLMASDTKEPSPLISKVLNHSNKEACYSFIEIGVAKNRSYYYVLEEVDINGKSIFHCDDIAAVTVGQGQPINLKAVKSYCQQVTASGN